MAEFEVGASVRVLREPGFADVYRRLGAVVDRDTGTPDLHRRYAVEVPTDYGTRHVLLAYDEMERDRPLPPPLEFETPPCSVCGTFTEYAEQRFRCPDCGCSWGRSGAHLHEGRWDDRSAQQCPDVLSAEEGSAVARQPDEAHRCMRTAGHAGDHVHPEVGEWVDRDDDDAA